MYFATECPVFFLFYWKYASPGLAGNEQHNAFVSAQFVLLALQQSVSSLQFRPDLRNLLSAQRRVPLRNREARNEVNLHAPPQNRINFSVHSYLLRHNRG